MSEREPGILTQPWGDPLAPGAVLDLDGPHWLNGVRCALCSRPGTWVPLLGVWLCGPCRQAPALAAVLREREAREQDIY
jgi:hypothetical protein